MTLSPAIIRREREQWDRRQLEDYQLRRLNELFSRILPANEFYAVKLAHIKLPLRSLEEFSQLPFTAKQDLIVDGAPHSIPANLTWPLDAYVRYHQTSGTHGRPMPVFDTADDWQWWIDSWQYVLDAAGVTAADRAMLAFSFGPFIGFWSAHDALVARGTLVIPGGGMNSRARLDLLQRTGATALFCTPTYALHLAEVADECKINLARTAVNKIIVAGEPGGSIPSVRERIENSWQARVIDHAGASEIGPWGYATVDGGGIHVLEAEFIAEFIEWGTGNADVGTENKGGSPLHSEFRTPNSKFKELVLTSLGRAGAPVIRYRTGDLAKPVWPSEGENRFVVLEGGVQGRIDDMLVIRGVNVFPTSVEQIVRSFPEIVEFRMTARKSGAMDELLIEVEDHLSDPARVAEELYLRLGLRIDVDLAPPLSLPRFEGKGRRFIDERTPEAQREHSSHRVRSVDAGAIEISWSDGAVRRYTVRHLRENCPCASCREQRTAPAPPPTTLIVLSPGELQPLSITQMEPVGRYAYSIHFSDGHDTGIYTLELLRELGTAFGAASTAQ